MFSLKDFTGSSANLSVLIENYWTVFSVPILYILQVRDLVRLWYRKAIRKRNVSYQNTVTVVARSYVWNSNHDGCVLVGVDILKDQNSVKVVARYMCGTVNMRRIPLRSVPDFLRVFNFWQWACRARAIPLTYLSREEKKSTETSHASSEGL